MVGSGVRAGVSRDPRDMANRACLALTRKLLKRCYHLLK